MMTFDLSAFEASLTAAVERIANPTTLGQAAEAGATVLDEAIISNIVTMDIVDTGEYRDSWKVVPEGASAMEASAATQSEVSHGPPNEFGTSKMAARPAVRTAIDSPDVQERVLEAEAAVLERALT